MSFVNASVGFVVEEFPDNAPPEDPLCDVMSTPVILLSTSITTFAHRSISSVCLIHDSFEPMYQSIVPSG